MAYGLFLSITAADSSLPRAGKFSGGQAAGGAARLSHGLSLVLRPLLAARDVARGFLCAAGAIWLVGTNLAAAPNGGLAGPVVEVFIPPAPGIRMSTAFTRAKGIASAIYADIGVRIDWKVAAALPSGCSRQDPMRRIIIVSFLFALPDGIGKEALAFAQPFAVSGPCVVLLLPRIQHALDGNPSAAASLLGHVLAHELGHYLQGAVRHSETGVMKARWSGHEWLSMGNRRLGFSPYDARWIRGGD